MLGRTIRFLAVLSITSPALTVWQPTRAAHAQTAAAVRPSVAVSDATVVEGPAGTATTVWFTLALSAPATGAVTVTAATGDGSAAAGADYSALAPTTVAFSSGDTVKTVSTTVTGDSLAEGTETFWLNLSSPSGATLGDGRALASILDDEGLPSVSINDVAVPEGTAGSPGTVVFTLSLAVPAARAVTVLATTANGTATAGSDYTAQFSTSVTFAPGETTRPFVVALVGDAVGEGNETLVVKLSAKAGSELADGQGRATILDDDGLLPSLAPGPWVSVGNATVVEGGPGTTAAATFTVTLSAAPLLPVTVTATTRNGTAAAGSDYTGLPPMTTIAFGPGETTRKLTVPVTGDSAAEGNETFLVDLSLPVGATLADAQAQATVLDDEGLPTASITDVTAEEWAGTTTTARFTVSLSAPPVQPVSVVAVTADSTAKAGPDYGAVPATTLSFAAGETSKSFAVAVTGDLLAEGDETFVVNLSSPKGVVLADAQGRATITPGKLRWVPPALTSPTEITINSDVIRARGANGHRWVLDDTKDYRITIGTVDTSYGVVVSGGRNVVILGGHITVPWAGTYPDNPTAFRDMAKRRALLVANQTGTLHIEGILIDNAGGDLTEGIQIQSPKADVQIENVRIIGVHARDQVSYTDNHPDCVQPMGVKSLRVDRFTCSSDAQAFYLDNGDGALGSAELRRVNVWGTVNNYPYLFHRVQREVTYPVVLSDVWVTPQPGDTLFNSVANVLIKGGAYQNKYTTRISADGKTASWPDDPMLTGVINGGAPGGGDFVPATVVGPHYVSPGYLG